MEVMIALFVFSTAVGTIFPIIVKIQQERVSIRQERTAEEVLLYNYHKIIYGQEASANVVRKGKVDYLLTVHEDSHWRVLCIEWEGKNGRNNKRCLSSNKR